MIVTEWRHFWGLKMNKGDPRDDSFDVVEIFRSIQGEGRYTGIPTVFLRFAGCNLRCNWCDTRYALEGGEPMTFEEIAEAVEELADGMVCLTGGEPLLQPGLPRLAREMLISGRTVLLETNGSVPVAGFIGAVDHDDLPEGWRRRLVVSMDVKTPSSGNRESFIPENMGQLRDWDQLKFIVSDGEDMAFAEEFVSGKIIPAVVIIQPADCAALEDMARRFLHGSWPPGLDVRFIIQEHKVIWSPAERGV